MELQHDNLFWCSKMLEINSQTSSCKNLTKHIWWVVGDNENGPKDNNVRLPINSHLMIPVIPREKEK